MKRFAFMFAAIAVMAISTGAAWAVPVEVIITGEVEFNQINPSPLGDANPGDAATLSFLVDSDVFLDGSFPTRGYEIDQTSFVLQLGATSLGLQDPFPAGSTPYFALRNDDPAVDGFWTSTNPDFPVGVELDQLGFFTQFLNNFSVTYTGDTLDSLDILDALGTYDFTGLTVFNWTIDDGPFNAMGLIFEQLTIRAVIGACCTDGPGTESECIEVSQDECDQAGPQGGLFLGPGTACDDVDDCVPLVVTMESLAAEEVSGGVVIRWSTALESDTSGFRVLRQTGNGREKRLSVLPGFIPATSAGLGGASYEYFDNSREAGLAVFYFILDVDLFGRETQHGPIGIDRGDRQVPATRESGQATRQR